MKNVVQRVLLVVISIPLLIASIFLPLDSHIILALLFGVGVAGLGSYEINSLIYHKGIKVKRWFIPSVNLIIYIFAYVYANNFFGITKLKSTIPIFILFVFSVFCFVYARDILKVDLTHSFEKMGYTLFGIIYIGIPSFFFPFLLNISLEPESPISIFYKVNSSGTLTGSLLFLFLVTNIWTNDIFAYVFGMLFGKSNVVGLPASPKKSWAGYIGGFLSNYLMVGLFYILFNRFLNFSIIFYIIVPFLAGFFVPIGDLVESVVKRSAAVKDSGAIIPGRGGILDSVDTLLFIIPIYFAGLQLYFSFL